MDDLRARGAQVIAVVVDPVSKNAEVATHFGLTFPILADPDLTAIGRWGVRHAQGAQGGDIARPATFVIDANGQVRWRDLTESYRRRPSPDDVLRALDGR
jgi:peroxiredoxin Q/BCP